MKLELIRQIFTEDFTLGTLLIEGKPFCYTVEDKVRAATEDKVFGKTAIPYGTYEVQMTMSNRFKVVMPLLINVPDFAGVRIHSGNTSADTEGCLILGKERTKNGVAQSRVACAELYELLEKTVEPITITITNA